MDGGGGGVQWVLCDGECLCLCRMLTVQECRGTTILVTPNSRQCFVRTCTILKSVIDRTVNLNNTHT